VNLCNGSNTILCISKILEKKSVYVEAVHLLFIDFKRACDSVRREVFYNMLIEFGFPVKLVRLIEMCLNETYSRVRVGKNLSDMFHYWEFFKTRCSMTFAFQLCFRICH